MILISNLITVSSVVEHEYHNVFVVSGMSRKCVAYRRGYSCHDNLPYYFEEHRFIEYSRLYKL